MCKRHSLIKTVKYVPLTTSVSHSSLGQEPSTVWYHRALIRSLSAAIIYVHTQIHTCTHTYINKLHMYIVNTYNTYVYIYAYVTRLWKGLLYTHSLILIWGYVCLTYSFEIDDQACINQPCESKLHLHGYIEFTNVHDHSIFCWSMYGFNNFPYMYEWMHTYTL